MPNGIWMRWAPGSEAGPSRQAEEVSLSASGENSFSSYTPVPDPSHDPDSGHSSGSTPVRGPSGQFLPGHAGTKPKGSRHRATVMVEAICAENAEAVMRTIVAKAIAGDTT